LKQAREHFDLKAKREAERQKKERAVVNDHVASGFTHGADGHVQK
jgi:hypothetical protein